MSSTTLSATSTAADRLADLLRRVAEVRPAQAARARAELEISLAGLRSSAVGELAWESSCLTPNRFPLEFSVTSISDELRTVVDVLAPEAHRGTAIEQADRIARRFGSAGLPTDTAELLCKHQQQFSPRFGAWLGSRHTATGTAHKLYAEVNHDPKNARELIAKLAPEAWEVLGGIGPVHFVGIMLEESAAVELYVRPPRTDRNLVRVLAARAGAPKLAEPLVSNLGASEDWASTNNVVSVSCAQGRVVAVAVCGFAHQRLGRDHRVRAHVLAQAEAERWPCATLYAAASAPLEQAAPLIRPFHTALSDVAVLGTEKIVHHIGLSPPPLTVTAPQWHLVSGNHRMRKGQGDETDHVGESALHKN